MTKRLRYSEAMRHSIRVLCWGAMLYGTILLLLGGPITFFAGGRYHLLSEEMDALHWHKNIGGPVFLTVMLLAWLPAAVFFVNQRVCRSYARIFIWCLLPTAAVQFMGVWFLHVPLFGEGVELSFLLLMAFLGLHFAKRALFSVAPPDASEHRMGATRHQEIGGGG